jgi:hypothetical protein
VAFHQALYNAYYVTRPEVPVEIAGRLMPGIDRGGVTADQQRAKSMPMPAPAPYRAQQERSVGAPAMAPPPPPPAELATAAEQIEASDAATQVIFKFPRAVSVENGRTLSIPIVDRQVPAARLALYQADTAARNPLAAIRLTNDGESGLPPGIITLYERDKGGYVSYVGDARLSGFPVGETRLLGLCARREDHHRARRGADRSGGVRHHRQWRAAAVARRAPDDGLSSAWSGQGAAPARRRATAPAGLDLDQTGVQGRRAQRRQLSHPVPASGR